MARVVKTRTEVEGVWHDQEVVLEGTDRPPWGPDAALAVVGRPMARIDGRERVTGRARFTHDVALPARARPRAPRGCPARSRHPRRGRRPPLRQRSCRLVLRDGEPPLRPACEVRRRGGGGGRGLLPRDRARRRRGRGGGVRGAGAAPRPRGGAPCGSAAALPGGNRAGRPEEYRRGDPEQGFREADELVSLELRTPGALHNALETHGAVAWWRDGGITLWDSTQFVHGVRGALAAKLGLPLGRVRVISEYMGGGFGAKNSLRKYVIAAHLARETGRPVRCILDRAEESLATGNRGPAVVRVPAWSAAGRPPHRHRPDVLCRGRRLRRRLDADRRPEQDALRVP